MSSWIKAHSQEILELACRHSMTNVRVFGAMVRGEANRTSKPDLNNQSL